MMVLEPGVALHDSVLEMRGDGKAGGGLVLAFQSLAALTLRDSSLHVQEWPIFSSARRGANIRSFLRMSRRAIDVACEVTRPAIALLMDEAAGRSVDFAQGAEGRYVRAEHPAQPRRLRAALPAQGACSPFPATTSARAT